MKHLKFIGFIFFLFSLTESLVLPTKPQDVAIQKFIEENTAYLTIIAVAQYVQEASFDEVEMLAKAMMAYRDRCLADGTLPECSKTANEVIQDMICAAEGLPQKYNCSHCCSKTSVARNLCFFYNKKANTGFLPPFPTLDPEEKCQAYKNNSGSFLNLYMYEVARRNPFVFSPVLLTVAARFEEVAATCCEEQEKATCFQAKATPITQYLKASASYQGNVCGALRKFGPKVLNSINTAAFSKKFPKIGFKDLTSILEDVSSMYDECCEGDVVQCVRSQSQVMKHICSKQDFISNKIKECCGKKTTEREACVINTNKEEKPDDLSTRDLRFTDDENICQERDSNQDSFFTEFLHEYSRRHTDFSTTELLRIAKVYKDLLKDCCSRENPASCYRNAEDKFNETTKKSLAMVQQECRHFQELDKNALKLHYLVKFTKVAPQLSMEELNSLSEGMMAALTTCCTLSEEFSCVDDLAELVLGDLCGVNENRTINPAVDHCCRADFAFRRHCFLHLEADTTYALPSVSALIPALRADWCQAHKEDEDLQSKKHRFIINLVKWMPEITAEERLCLFTKFTATREKCSDVQEPEACFRSEYNGVEVTCQGIRCQLGKEKGNGTRKGRLLRAQILVMKVELLIKKDKTPELVHIYRLPLHPITRFSSEEEWNRRFYNSYLDHVTTKSNKMKA